MLNNAIPASATALPVVMPPAVAFAPPPGLSIVRAEWAASVGRIAADMAALSFRLPLPAHLACLFEDVIRQQVAADLLAVPHLSDEDCHQLEDIACLAFGRRLSRHASMAHVRGQA